MNEPSSFAESLFDAADADVHRVQAAFFAAVARLAPGLMPAAHDLLERIATPNWALEWCLPLWVGENLGLPHDTQRLLMLSNVFGLGYVRVQDDLTDDEAAKAPREEALALSTLLYHLWMDAYRDLFSAHPAFWPRLDAILGEWVQATLAGNQPNAGAAWPLTEPARLQLAHRGAPLKLAPGGACLLAGKDGLIPTWDEALEHLLAAMVLFDHAQDWRDDLAAGRYNAFIAYASPLPQTAEHREANQRAVFDDMLHGRGGRPYFARIMEEADAAERLAQRTACAGLGEYLARLKAGLATSGERWAESYQAHLRAITAQLLDLPVD
jgi:hypothetical protein